MKHSVWLVWALCAATVWADDATEAARRKTILDRAATRSTELDQAERKANEAYDAALAGLQAEIVKQREAHAAKRVEHALALRKIDEGYGATLERIATTKKNIQAAHERVVAGLDTELKSIQDRARGGYTDALSQELRDHDKKRKDAEADRKAKLEAAETSRVRAIDTYLADVTKTQEAQQAELKTLDEARTKLLAAHDTRRAAARETLQKELDRIRAARREAQVATATELYETVGIPGRTTPPLGAERHDLIDLSWERADASGAAAIDILVAGKPLADEDAARKLREAVGRAIVPNRPLNAEDGFDDTLRTLTFGSTGALALGGEPVEIRFAFAVDDLKLPMPVAVQRSLLTRVERAVAQAHDRLPWDDFKVGERRPSFYLLDAEGKVSRPQSPAAIAAVREILTARGSRSVQGLAMGNNGPELSGKTIRIGWQMASDDGAYAPVDAATQKALDRRFHAQVARLTGTGTVPSAVRRRLDAAVLVTEDANLQRPLPLHAAAGGEAYRFYRQGRELVVIDAKTSEVVFRIEGLYQLTRFAAGPDGGLAFAATRVTFAKPVTRSWTKRLDYDLKVAEVVDDERSTTVKAGEALFVYAGGELTLALSPTLGRFGAVRPTTGGYRVWFWDRDERELVKEFTLKVQRNGSAAEPDVAATPAPAQLALQAPGPVAPAPRPKSGGPR